MDESIISALPTSDQGEITIDQTLSSPTKKKKKKTTGKKKRKKKAKKGAEGAEGADTTDAADTTILEESILEGALDTTAPESPTKKTKRKKKKTKKSKKKELEPELVELMAKEDASTMYKKTKKKNKSTGASEEIWAKGSRKADGSIKWVQIKFKKLLKGSIYDTGGDSISEILIDKTEVEILKGLGMESEDERIDRLRLQLKN